MTPEEQIKALQTEIASLKEGLKGLDEAKTQLKDTSQFIEDASILVSAIMKDPALKANVQASISGQPVAPTATPTPTPAPAAPDKSTWKFDPETGKPLQATPATEPPKDTRVDGIDGSLRLKAIQAVESKFKIGDKDRPNIRKNVGAWLRSYNLDVNTIPVDQLEEKLNDAYLHVGLEVATKDGADNKAVIDSYFDDTGKLPSMSGGSPDTSATTLSPVQKKWADKLDVSEDKVAAGLKELTETGVIAYKPKEKAAANNTPNPSGTPTPPVSPAVN